MDPTESDAAAAGEEAQPEAHRAATRRAALLVATLASFLTPFMGSAINIALPAIGREFAMDAVVLGWVATSYLLAAAMFLVPFGKLADMYGRKRVFVTGITVYTLSSLLTTASTSAFVLIAFRVLQGIGSAMVFGTGVAILTSVYPPGERGKVLGINVASVYLGGSLGPFLGGILTQHLGWRSVFWANLPLGVVIIVFAWWKLKGEWAEARGERFDLVGTFLYSTSLVALMYGFSRLTDATGDVSLVAGLFGIAGFVAWETRTRSPLLNMDLFRTNRTFALSNLAALIHYSATAAVAFLLSLYLQYVKALPPQAAGLVLVSQPIVMALFSPFAGRLSDRVEPRVVASAGMGLTATGLLLLSFVGETTPLPSIVACLVLLGFGFALFSSPNTNAVMSAVERRFYGVAAATMGTMRLTGQMLSMGFTMLLFTFYIGKSQITPETYPLFLKSARTVFSICTVLCAGGIFASLARGRIRPGGGP